MWQTSCWQMYPSHRMVISQIPALSGHIWFLLWVLICGRPCTGRSTPPHIEWWFHRLLLWQIIFHSYSECSCVADHALADLPPPHIEWWFHRFLLWQIIFHSYSESSYVADQVLADLSPIEQWFHRFPLWQLIFHSYSESSNVSDQVLANLPPDRGI